MQFLYSLIICALACITFSTARCPNENDINPCTCFESLSAITISCHRLTFVDQLKRLVKGAENLKSFHLWIFNSNISNVPNDTFKDAKIFSLHIEESEIITTGASGKLPLVGLEKYLRELNIKKSYTSKSRPMTAPFLGNLKKLDDLTVEFNYMSKLGNDWFGNSTNSLKNVKFFANDIDELEDKAFANLENLEYFTLASNINISLTRSLFPKPATYLSKLDLSRNRLTSLPVDIFSDMPQLDTVILFDNEMKTISESTWSHVWNRLYSVDLYHNPIVCDSRIKWIVERKTSYLTLTGECDEPEALEGKELDRLKLSDFE